MIEGKHYIFMDRGQIFLFQWMEPRYVFHTWSSPEYSFGIESGMDFFSKNNTQVSLGSIMVAPQTECLTNQHDLNIGSIMCWL